MKKKITKLRIHRKATPADIGRARGKAANFANGPGEDDDFPIVDGGSAPPKMTVQSSTIQTDPKNVSQKEFYKFRDAVYSLIKEQGKDIGSLPGNPFSIFSHGTIKDSPLKNYANETRGLKNMVKKYFPDIYADVQNMAIASQKRSIINTPLNEGSIEEILQDVTSEQIRLLEEKEAFGRTLTNAEKKILQAYRHLNNKIREGVNENIENQIGEWLIKNWLVVVIGLVLLIMVIKGK